MARKYKVIINGRTFQIYTDKEKAVMGAKNCFNCGFTDVSVTYGNWNPVPKTPHYIKTEERNLGKPRTIIIMQEKKPHIEVRKFLADKIVCVADKNKIDPIFFREFYNNGDLIGRYRSDEFYFDMAFSEE